MPPRTSLAMPAEMMHDTQVQVLNWNRADDTMMCLRSILRQGVRRPNIVVVDNGSVDGSAELIIDKFPEVEVLRLPLNEGFSGGHNRAFRHGMEKGRKFFLLLNNDARLAPDALTALLSAADANPVRGVLGAWVLQDTEEPRLESRGVRFSPMSGRMIHLGFDEAPPEPGPVENVTAVSGCAMLVRREVLDRVGLLNDEYFAYFEDIDLCLRAARAGFLVASVPAARVIHRGKATLGGAASPHWVYYAIRNHLLLLSRNCPMRPRALGALRTLWVIALNLGHVLFASRVPRMAGTRAIVAGINAYRRGEFGARRWVLHPSPSSS